MIPYEIDPSLHASEPLPAQLDDGFSPPSSEPVPVPAVAIPDAVEPLLWAKSAF